MPTGRHHNSNTPARCSTHTLALNVALVAVILSACATAPPPVNPDLDFAVPNAWASVVSSESPLRGQTDSTTAWWSDFESPPLGELIAEVLERNHDLEAAVARVDARAAQARIAAADGLPEAAFNFSASRTKRNFVGFPFGGPGASSDVPTSRSNLHTVGIDFSWEVDVWGRVRAAHQAAIADWQAAAADYHGLRLSLEAQTARLWFQIVEARRQLALAEATRDSFQTTLDQVQGRYERGLRPALDVRLARAQLAAAVGSVDERTRLLRALQRQLEILLGRYPAALVETTSELPGFLRPTPAGLPAELLGRRPDLAAVEREVAAAESRVKESHAALLPRISLTASGGTSSDELKDLVDRDFSIWQLAANLMQPLFQGGRLRANVRVAEAQRREATANYVSTALQAFSEVEDALSAELLLARRETALAEAAKESRAADQLAQERYARGLERFVTVLEAQRRAFVSESDLLLVRRLRVEARIDLHLALGGGFAAETIRPAHRKKTPNDTDCATGTSRRIERHMNRLLKFLAPPVVLGIAIAIAGAMLQSGDETETNANSAPPPVVRVVTVTPTTRDFVVKSQGTVTPRTRIELVAQVAGEITGVAAAWAEGGFFEAGDSLVSIDKRDYQVALARATAEVARADVQVALEEEEANVALREWKALGSNAKAPSALVLREPQLREARAAAKAAQATLDQAKLDLERTEIRAPFRGRVLERRVDVGQFVNRGTVLGRVYAVDYVEIRLPILDSDLAFLDVPLSFGRRDATDGPIVRLTARFAGKSRTWEGRVVRTEGEVDLRSRMVHVVARVPDPYDRTPPLAAGMFVTAAIQGRRAENVVDLPRHAVLRRKASSLGLASAASNLDGNPGSDRQGPQDWVLIVDAESRLRYRPVEVLRWQGNRAFVKSGLAAGERVCLSVLEVVVDGMAVRVEENAGRD